MKRPKIVVFDSGVGGLTILSAIQDELPRADYVYCSDNAAHPYGDKPADELTARVAKVLDALVRRCRPDILVVACNTASTVALPHLRQQIAIPVVGVVPAIKPAAALTRTKAIGLLATPGTVVRPYTLELITKFASDCRIVKVGSRELVRIAEAKLRGLPVATDVVVGEVAPFFDDPDAATRVDTIVLGCTHFPLLLDELKVIAPWDIDWIDSGEAIARRVRTLLAEGNAFAPAAFAATPDGAPDSRRLEAVFTRFDRGVESLRPALAQRHFTSVLALFDAGDSDA